MDQLIHPFLFSIISESTFISKKENKHSAKSNKEPNKSTFTSYLGNIEGFSQQNIGSFYIRYGYPFLKSEDETQNLIYKIFTEMPEMSGYLKSLAIYTSKTSCEINEARLTTGFYAQDVIVNMDAMAQGSIDQILVLDDVREHQVTITPQTISGLPAREISFFAKRRGGVFSVNAINIVEPRNNVFLAN